MASFEDFGLSEPVLEAIRKMGFVEPTPIQKKALPLVLEGQDVLGQAQTGTGKTAAFGIPIAQKLAADAEQVQALILCPTRELAVQVAEEVHEICLISGHKVLPVYGGQRIDRQIMALKKGVQVVVGTPGRILDHLGRGTLKLSGVKFLVLDEADMMLDMGFLPDIRRILRQCPADRQTLLFSATIPDDIRRISRDYMREPESVSVVPETLTVQETEQIFYEVAEDEKIEALMRLLDYEEEGSTAMIFCRTKRNVDKLTRKLQSRGYDVEGLHGDLTQQQRDRIMAGFRESKFAYLVATDVAARGLDISHVTHVINYHIPQDPEAYVHRIGRTGRMGREGVAITFVTPAEYWDLLRIQEFSMAVIEAGELPSEVEVEERRRAARGDRAARRRVQAADRRGRRGTLELVTAGDGDGEAAVETAARAGMLEQAVEPVQGVPAAGAAAALEAGEPAGAAEVEGPRPRAPRRRRKEAEPFVALPEIGGQPATEAERHQRRYTLRDAQKRIEWTEAEEAMKEAARIEREQLISAAHEAAAETAGVETAGAEGAAPESVLAAEHAERVRAVREAARRLDVEARLREAERQVAEAREAGTLAEAPTPTVEALPSLPSEPAVLPPVEVTAAAEAVTAEEAPEAVPGRAEEGAVPARPSRRRGRRAAKGEVPADMAAEREGAAAETPETLISREEEERILRALRLRDQAYALVRSLGKEDLDDFVAIVDRLELDFDLRTITAALLRELAERPGEAAPARRRGRRAAAPREAAIPTTAISEEVEPAEELEEEGADVAAADADAMTRLFISIGRRARLNREGLQRLLLETAGISEDDIGRIDLLHNFAFVEVRKAVASLVVEKMHHSMFRGRGISVEPAKSATRDAQEETGEQKG